VDNKTPYSEELYERAIKEIDSLYDEYLEEKLRLSSVILLDGIYVIDEEHMRNPDEVKISISMQPSINMSVKTLSVLFKDMDYTRKKKAVIYALRKYEKCLTVQKSVLISFANTIPEWVIKRYWQT
jgi:hypothetical protein